MLQGEVFFTAKGDLEYKGKKEDQAVMGLVLQGKWRSLPG